MMIIIIRIIVKIITIIKINLMKIEQWWKIGNKKNFEKKQKKINFKNIDCGIIHLFKIKAIT